MNFFKHAENKKTYSNHIIIPYFPFKGYCLASPNSTVGSSSPDGGFAPDRTPRKKGERSDHIFRKSTTFEHKPTSPPAERKEGFGDADRSNKASHKARSNKQQQKCTALGSSAYNTRRVFIANRKCRFTSK